MTQNRGLWFGEHGSGLCGFPKVENFLSKYWILKKNSSALRKCEKELGNQNRIKTKYYAISYKRLTNAHLGY
jgi:hypothetical protein